MKSLQTLDPICYIVSLCRFLGLPNRLRCHTLLNSSCRRSDDVLQLVNQRDCHWHCKRNFQLEHSKWRKLAAPAESGVCRSLTSMLSLPISRRRISSVVLSGTSKLSAEFSVRIFDSNFFVLLCVPVLCVYFFFGCTQPNFKFLSIAFCALDSSRD